LGRSISSGICDVAFRHVAVTQTQVVESHSTFLNSNIESEKERKKERGPERKIVREKEKKRERENDRMREGEKERKRERENKTKRE